MKTFILTIFALVVAVPAFAATAKELVLYNSSTSSNGTAYRVDQVNKSITFAGYSNNGNQRSVVPGTITLQVAPTSSGPWVTAKDVANASVTNAAAAASTFNLQSAFKWVRVVFTKTANSFVGVGRAKAFIAGLSDN